MKNLYTALLLTCLAACMREPVNSVPTNNSEIKVDRLFDHDGCTVYRFLDGGYPRYFVKCSSGDARTEWSDTYQCGRSTCDQPMQVPTV